MRLGARRCRHFLDFKSSASAIPRPGQGRNKNITQPAAAPLLHFPRASKSELVLHSDLKRVSETVQLSGVYSSNRAAYSQCDHALPCSSCFFLASASMRRRSEHSSQMVVSEGLPHILQTCRACSGRGSAASLGIAFMVASLAACAEAWAARERAHSFYFSRRASSHQYWTSRPAERSRSDNRCTKPAKSVVEAEGELQVALAAAYAAAFGKYFAKSRARWIEPDVCGSTATAPAAPVRMVDKVESLGAELEAHPLVNGEGLK